MGQGSFLSRLGRGLFLLLCTAGVIAGGFLLLCAGGWVDPKVFSEEPAAETVVPAASPREELPDRAAFLPLERLDQAAAYQAVAVPMKGEDGALGYVSALTPAMDAGASSGDPGRNQALRSMNALPGLHTVALVSCLRDGAAGTLEGMALERPGGVPWRDAGGMTWLDPANPAVEDYLSGICRELAALGFDEILLTNCGYPDGETGPDREERRANLEAFCRGLQAELERSGVLLSVEGAGDASEGESLSGQTTGLLASFHRVWAAEEDREALAVFRPVPLPGP